MVAAKSGFGIRLQKGDGASPEVFTTVAGITNLDGPQSTAATIDATDNDDVSTGVGKYISVGYRLNGEVNIQGNLVHANATQKAMQTALASLSPSNFKIVDSAGASLFGADPMHVTKFSRAHPHDNTMTYDIGLMIVQALTIA